MIIGLTTNIERLIQIRRNRLLSLNQAPETDYVDVEAVNAELAFARRMFADNGWPVIDVTRRSIEETAATVLQLMEAWHNRQTKAGHSETAGRGEAKDEARVEPPRGGPDGQSVP